MEMGMMYGREQEEKGRGRVVGCTYARMGHFSVKSKC
jgi:hypothetical protein